MSIMQKPHLLDQDEFDEEINYAIINAERGQMAAEKGEWISCRCRLEEARWNLKRASVCLAERLRVVNQQLDGEAARRQAENLEQETISPGEELPA